MQIHETDAFVPGFQDVLGKEKLSRCRVYVEAMEHEAGNHIWQHPRYES